MNIVLLQSPLSQTELNQLLKEFPQYIFLSLSEFDLKKLSEDDWAKVEILFGDKLNREELEKAHQLRWIHSPSPHLHRLCLPEIEKQGNILVTTTNEENIFQIGEFFASGILAFAKQLFQWKQLQQTPEIVWDSKYRASMWSLKNRKMLQLGLGKVGTEIARRAKELGMTVWGAQERVTFHQHCEKTFSFQEIHSLLPAVDIVSLALPRGKQREGWFGEKELELMKEDSILCIAGNRTLVDEEQLYYHAKKGKFRGVVFDAYYQIPFPASSRLWELPNVLITPEISPRPKDKVRQSTRIFRFNLRQFQYGNIMDMKNPVTSIL